MKINTDKRVARIAECVGGYCISDDALDYIDERGRRYASRRAAIASLAPRDEIYNPRGYTHYLSPIGREIRIA